METVVRIVEAEVLAPVMYIPSEMRGSRLEVTLRPIEEAAAGADQKAYINKEIMRKFRKAAESEEAKEQIRKKLAEGTHFDFDAAKLIHGNMTEDDWQKLYDLQKQTWPEAAAKKAGM
ncbi:MAG: hypothetical protein LBK13_04530 [Spirochaetales bacterium]|jgi:hypothetical protein|nr:hypothetical protein [Spirochaetales bacterium]